MIMHVFDFLTAEYLGTPEQNLIIAIFGACLCVFGIIILFLQLISMRRKRIVAENSEYYQNVLELNESTQYHASIADDGELTYTMYVNSKAKFDRTEPIASLYEYISIYSDEINTVLDQVSENRKTYREYIAAFDALSSRITYVECENLRINYVKFRETEQKLVSMEKLDMIMSLEITCKVAYTSPKGQNHYEKECTYLESEIRTAIKDVDARVEFMRSEAWRRKNERSKVTPSLRYDVMRRDGFRCCLCGRSAANGAELEVDHIVPVSKGGNTTYGNLQTLCRECNRGKGAKMTE